MVGLTRDNGGHRYILTVIDIFSKYAWAIPVKNKDGKSVRDAFKSVLASSDPRKPDRLQTDKGKEFFNREFSDLMRLNGIQHFASESDQKAAVVERFNRTLKTRIWTYLSAKRTKKWVEVLPAILTSYNGSYHRSIGMAPNKVTADDQDRIWTRLYGDGDTYLKRKRIADGATVRISRVKGVFDKGYMPNWSRKQFTVASTVPDGDKRRHNGRPVVTLKDESGEVLRGKWYPEEIQQVRDNDFEVEKVLKRRTGADGTRELFVKWRDYPSNFNSWIREQDLIV
jgi:transposase InsO family protein